jgi:hypothetical protein
MVSSLFFEDSKPLFENEFDNSIKSEDFYFMFDISTLELEFYCEFDT